MKRLLIIPMLFVFFVTALLFSGCTRSASIIGKSIRIGNFEVAQNDFPNQMDWFDAQKACASLGPGWRLPTQDELKILYQNKDKIGGFARSYYWSSTEADSSSAWEHNFNDGLQNFSSKGNPTYVRAIRAF